MLDFENDNGVIEKKSLPFYMLYMMNLAIQRSFLPVNQISPYLMNYFIQPSDRRYSRNVDRFRAFCQSVIDERRSGKSKSYGDNADLLSILL